LPFAAAGHGGICAEPDENLRGCGSGAGLHNHGGVESIEAESIDFVYFITVLERIEDDAGALAWPRDRLKPHGELLVCVSAFPSLLSAMGRKLGCVRRYRHAGLVALLERGGCKNLVIVARRDG
jgi:hypothetical protein